MQFSLHWTLYWFELVVHLVANVRLYSIILRAFSHCPYAFNPHRPIWKWINRLSIDTINRESKINRRKNNNKIITRKTIIADNSSIDIHFQWTGDENQTMHCNDSLAHITRKHLTTVNEWNFAKIRYRWLAWRLLGGF